ncbi:MAG TPA: ATP-binding protein, partial [Marmoricola sp.]
LEPWSLNAHAPGPVLKRRWPLSEPATRELRKHLLGGALTHRGSVRVHRLAWTVADLAGVEQPGRDELAVALRLRRGEPLESRTLRVAQ